MTDTTQAADLEIIERHTRQAQRVLQDLLNFARPKTAGSGTADAGAVAAACAVGFAASDCCCAANSAHSAAHCRSIILGRR